MLNVIHNKNKVDEGRCKVDGKKRRHRKSENI